MCCNSPDSPTVQTVQTGEILCYVALVFIRENVYELRRSGCLCESAVLAIGERSNWGDAAIHQTKLLYGEFVECKTESQSGSRSYLNQWTITDQKI